MHHNVTTIDETIGQDPDRYSYEATVEANGNIIRAKVVRGPDVSRSRATVEVLARPRTWSQVTAQNPGSWFSKTSPPDRPGLNPSRELRPIVSNLINRAINILDL
ncbi:hypothetical protein EIL87_12390 [Saccharopolyspora rhizosphaerae]|uniref:Uncharacterized protein n=1 Tax=Saccharopolyspora rhizosphaerae TaxID=2492662 RepID=A0A426JV67_9PSEU|nr:hypothetical protein [Saccharopolyspora rhizosphaerae]RRO17064.1 hypothetical protein EIL87_12390 [Saccharopolyspora rhizosphaerae]